MKQNHHSVLEVKPGNRTFLDSDSVDYFRDSTMIGLAQRIDSHKVGIVPVVFRQEKSRPWGLAVQLEDDSTLDEQLEDDSKPAGHIRRNYSAEHPRCEP